MSRDYVVTVGWSMKRRKHKNDKKRKLRRPRQSVGTEEEGKKHVEDIKRIRLD